MIKKIFIVFFALYSSISHSQDYFPIEPGAEWTYVYSDAYDPSGVAQTTVSLGEELVSRAGETYYEMESKTVFSKNSAPTISKTYVRKAMDGAIYGINPEVSEDEYLFFPASPSEGQVWTGLSGSASIIDTDSSVKTSEGDFINCVVVESVAGEVKAYSYYQEGKGLVAMKLGDTLMMFLKE